MDPPSIIPTTLDRPRRTLSSKDLKSLRVLRDQLLLHYPPTPAHPQPSIVSRPSLYQRSVQSVQRTKSRVSRFRQDNPVLFWIIVIVIIALVAPATIPLIGGLII